MKNNRKLPALAAVLSLGLLLTSCYIPPDDISDQTQNLTVGSSNVPFMTIASATASPTPTQVPVVVLTQNPSPIDPQFSYDWTNMTDNTLSTDQYAQHTVSVITNTPMPTSTPTRLPTDAPAPTSSTLRNGSSGDRVKNVQQRLKELGFYTGSVDGDFGDGTESAVKAFQRANGLTVDGAAGPATVARLNSSSAVAAPTATPKPTPKRTAKPTAKPTSAPTERPTSSTLRNGDSGTMVKTVQQRLKDLGYYSGSVDGKFGDGTETAVRAFQKKNRLDVDGAVGPATMARLNSSGALAADQEVTKPTPKVTPKPTAKPTPKPTAVPKPTPTMKVENTYISEGQNGTGVKKLQERLIYLGWLAGTPDGEYGPATQAAVIAFQKKTKGLYDDGVAGPETLRALMADNAARASTPAAVVGETLEMGSEGGTVRALQQRLKELSYYSGSIDGSFGEGTQVALIAFQLMNDLTPDGKAGALTLSTLYAVDAIANR